MNSTRQQVLFFPRNGYRLSQSRRNSILKGIKHTTLSLGGPLHQRKESRGGWTGITSGGEEERDSSSRELDVGQRSYVAEVLKVKIPRIDRDVALGNGRRRGGS